MPPENIARRLLAALGDSSPAFTDSVDADIQSSGRRLLAALAGSTPAFLREINPDEYRNGPRVATAWQVRTRLSALTFVALLAGLASWTFGNNPTIWSLYGAVLFSAIFGEIFYTIVRRFQVNRALASELPAMAAKKWISSTEIVLLSSSSGRHQWRKQVRKKFGREAARAVARYQAAVIELALQRRASVQEDTRVHVDDFETELISKLQEARHQMSANH